MRRHEHPNHARFLTFSCEHRLPLFDNDAIKDKFVHQLRRTRERHAFLLHAWVVMPEHVHLLIRFPGPATVPDVLRTLKTGLAKRVVARWRELDASVLGKITDERGNARFWLRGGGYDRNVFSAKEVEEKIAYIHANPVRRGLVERPEDWAWSSARWWQGRRDDELPCDQPS